MHGFYNMHLIPGRMVWRPSTRGLGKRLWFNRWTGVARGKTRELVRTVCCHVSLRIWLAQSAVSAAVASDLRTIVVFWMLVSARKLQPES